MMIRLRGQTHHETLRKHQQVTQNTIEMLYGDINVTFIYSVILL